MPPPACSMITPGPLGIDGGGWFLLILAGIVALMVVVSIMWD